MPFTEIPETAAIDLDDERLVIGDTTEFVTKMNSYMTKLEAWAAAINASIESINTRGEEIEATQVSDAAGITLLQTQLDTIEAGAGLDVDDVAQAIIDVNALLAQLGDSPGIANVAGLTAALAARLPDQTYDAVSALPQSGVAVAGALAGAVIEQSQVVGLPGQLAQLKIDDVAALVSDTGYGYAGGAASQVSAGSVVYTRSGLAFYVVASDATEYDQITAGGVKLAFSTGNLRAPIEAFHTPGETDYTDSLNRMFAFAVANNVQAVAGGVFDISGTIAPGGRFTLQANKMRLRADVTGTYTEITEQDGVGGFQGTGKYTIFDVSGCAQSVINGHFELSSNQSAANMSIAGRANIPAWMVGMASVSGSCADLSIEFLRLTELGYWMFQGVNSDFSIGRSGALARLNIKSIYGANCLNTIVCGQDGNMFDDAYIGVINMSKCVGQGYLRRSDLVVASLFMNGLTFAADAEPQTVSATAGSATVTLSAANANIVVGTTVAIEGASLAGNGTTPIPLITTVNAISGNNITLDDAAEITDSGLKLILDPQTIVVSTGSLVFNHLFVEGVFDTPFEIAIGGSVRTSGFKLSAGTVGARLGSPFIVNSRNRADVSLVLDNRSNTATCVKRLVSCCSLYDDSYSSARVDITTGARFSDISSRMIPFELIARPASMDDAISTDRSNYHNPNIQAVVHAADGDVWYSPVLGSLPAMIVNHAGSSEIGPNLLTSDDYASAITTGTFSETAGVATKVTGGTGTVYSSATLTEGALYRLQVNIEAISGAFEVRIQNNATLLTTFTRLDTIGRNVVHFKAPAGASRVLLFGFSTTTATLSGWSVRQELSGI